MRLHKDTKVRLIRSLPLFAECTSDEVAEVAAVADEIQLLPGKLMTREHAEGGEFVVICSGSAEVHRGERTIAALERGDFFGETALVTGRPRNATVVATSPVRALVIEGHAFRTLLEHSPSVRAKVDRAVAERAVDERLPAAG